MRPLLIVQAVVTALLLVGCVGNRPYNADLALHVRTLAVAEDDPREYDLCVIEFDDNGQFWEPAQLDSTLDLIERRNREHPEGVAVILFTHGWKNNADFEDEKGNMRAFADSLGHIVARFDTRPERTPRHIVGVYIGWRGDTLDIPFIEQTTFWQRLAAAERVASLNMQEALFSVMHATQRNRASRCYVYGHSMGGLIVARTLRPAFTSLILDTPNDGFRMPSDLVVLLNPAVDAHEAALFIDFLKRREVRTVHVEPGEDPETRATRPGGPLVVSITSAADNATGFYFPIGRELETLALAMRRDSPEGFPSQGTLRRRAEGHVDALVSHDAFVRDGEVVLERREGAWNNTPYWIVRTSGDIIPGHSDFSTEFFDRLIDIIQEQADLFDTRTEQWVLPGAP